MPKYDFLKVTYSKVSNFVNMETIKKFKLNKLKKYIKLKNGINLFNNYLLYTPIEEEEFEKVTHDDIKEINNIVDNTNANIYLYFVETDSTYNFETNKKINIYDYLSTNLKIDKNNIAIFEINSFEDYKKIFYKTDHHWNNKGSDKGYREIASLNESLKYVTI